jgi:hypothetical protein
MAAQNARNSYRDRPGAVRREEEPIELLARADVDHRLGELDVGPRAGEPRSLEEERCRVIEILQGAPVLVQSGHTPSTSTQGWS